MKVLILSCNTGQGHNSAGRAIQEELDRRQIHCQFSDAYALAGGDKVSERMSKAYNRLAIHAPNVYGLLYQTVEVISSPHRKASIYRINPQYLNKVYDYIQANEFDTLIMSHIFPAQVYTSLKRRRHLNLRNISLMTDYTCSPLWNNIDTDHLVIPHNQLTNEFMDHGIPKEKLLPLGIPVSEAFSQRTDRHQSREQLGLPPHLPVIVLMSGSMGFGRLDDLVQGLLTQYGESVSIVVLGGNNHAMKSKLRKEYRKNRNVYVLDFTNKVSLYMDAGDMVFTKPGGLSITELAVKNIPTVLTAPIPGVETHNAAFFEQNQLALYRPKLSGQLEAASLILSDSSYRDYMLSAQRAFINANAAHDICDYLIGQA